MPLVKIPFGGPLNISVDEHAIDEKESPLIINAYLDKRDNLVRRPGVTPFATGYATGSGKWIDGIYWWDEPGWLVAVSGGKMYIKTTPSGAWVSQSASSMLTEGYYVDFASVDGAPDPSIDRQPTLFMATRHNMMYMKSAWNTFSGTGAGTRIPSAGTNPTPMLRNANALATLDNYLCFTEDQTQSWHYVLGKSIEDPTTGIYGDNRADADTDNAVSIRQLLESLYIFSRRHVEIWQNDQQSPFSRVRGGVIDSGITERQTLANIGQAFMYVDKYQNVVILDGRSTENISVPISKAWKGQSTNADLISASSAYVIYFNHNAWYVLNIPAIDRTFVYDLIMKRWFEWGTLGSDKKQHMFDGSVYAYARDWNLHCFGSRTSDTIYYLDETRYFDKIANSDIRPLVATSRTTDLDHGTSKRKRINRLYVHLHRGLVNSPSSSTETPIITLRWQDDGAMRWSGDKQIKLGPIGDGRHVVTIPGVGGVFRKRQWEWSISSPYALDLIDVQADITEMTS